MLNAFVDRLLCYRAVRTLAPALKFDDFVVTAESPGRAGLSAEAATATFQADLRTTSAPWQWAQRQTQTPELALEGTPGERRYARANTLTRPASPLHSTTVRPWSSTRRGREFVS